LRNQKKRRNKDEARLEKIHNSNRIYGVLLENKKSYDDFVNYFNFLKITGLGEDLAWEIVSNPKDLKKLIYLKDKGCSDIEIAAEFMKL
jgi:hypothetical protein